MTIYNRQGTPWLVRLLQPGDGYGVNDQLVWTPAQYPDLDGTFGVEFYDLRQDPDKFGPRGQFVSRYYVETLFKHHGGINLDGGVPSWYIDNEPMTQVICWLHNVTKGVRNAELQRAVHER